MSKFISLKQIEARLGKGARLYREALEIAPVGCFSKKPELFLPYPKWFYKPLKESLWEKETDKDR